MLKRLKTNFLTFVAILAITTSGAFAATAIKSALDTLSVATICDENNANCVDVSVGLTAGGVTGPGSSTDNAITRFDGTGGSTLQNSGATVNDSGVLDAVGFTEGASNTLTNDISGNSATSTALAANGANCTAGNSPLGVDASGAVETCFDVWTEAENTAAAYIANVVEDTTPQLGGNLDVNGNTITSAGAGNVTISPAGAGVATVEAGSGGVTIQTNSGNSDIDLSPHGSGVVNLSASTDLSFNNTAILSDSAGTMTLSNVDALDATTTSTIQAAVGGGGAFADVLSICASGCDYVDVAALVAGETAPYRAYLNGSITEDSDVALDGDFTFFLNDFVYTIGDFQYIGTNDPNVEVIGWSHDSEIDWTHTVANEELFDAAGSADINGGSLIFVNVYFDNNSTSADTEVNHAGWGKIFAENIWYDAPNTARSGFQLASGAHFINNIDCVGPGTSATGCLNISSGAHVSNVRLSGTWEGFTGPIICSSEDAVINNIVSEITGDAAVCGSVTGVREISGSLDLDVGAKYTTLSDVRISGTLDPGVQDFVQVSNFDINTIDMTDTGMFNFQASNGFVTAAATLNSDDANLSNVKFTSGLTISSSADETSLVNVTGSVTDNGTNTYDNDLKTIQAVITEFTTNTATGDGQFYYSVPTSAVGNLVDVHCEVITAGTTGTTDIQIHNVTQAADMLTTKITIDSAETGSDTAATAAVIDTANDDVAEHDVIRFDVDAVSTTPAQGLICKTVYRRP